MHSYADMSDMTLPARLSAAAKLNPDALHHNVTRHSLPASLLYIQTTKQYPASASIAFSAEEHFQSVGLLMRMLDPFQENPSNERAAWVPSTLAISMKPKVPPRSRANHTCSTGQPDDSVHSPLASMAAHK
eukprot:GHVQ01001647.1.p2 GENE.GHVQ01001647.1~~GHVQ01001647.1.p2  ORF type:complete len:131 (-),score=14.80 GHVQ01001647.1:666-1058(-)